MENLYLNSDESILLTTQNVVVEGIRHEAILTSRRLILVRNDDPKAPHREIPLAAIGSAIAGENPLREPTITLAMTDPEGVLNTVQLVFIRLVSEQKNPQFTEWVDRLKERISVTVKAPEPVCAGPATGAVAHEPIPPKELEISPAQPAPCNTPPQVPSYVFRPPKPAGPPDQSGFFSKAVVFIVVIAIVAIGAVLAIQFMKTGSANAGSSPATTAAGAAATTTVPVAKATTLKAPSPTAVTTIQAAETAAPQVVVPATGVWVRVRYDGVFSGSVGTSGRMREVNSTGDQFYQIPATDGIIVADIQKMDGTGGTISVELYRNGSLLKQIDSSKPNAHLLLDEPL